MSQDTLGECSDSQQVAEEVNLQAAQKQTFREFFPFPEGWGGICTGRTKGSKICDSPNTCSLITWIQKTGVGEDNEHKAGWET